MKFAPTRSPLTYPLSAAPWFNYAHHKWFDFLQDESFDFASFGTSGQAGQAAHHKRGEGNNHLPYKHVPYPHHHQSCSVFGENLLEARLSVTMLVWFDSTHHEWRLDTSPLSLTLSHPSTLSLRTKCKGRGNKHISYKHVHYPNHHQSDVVFGMRLLVEDNELGDKKRVLNTGKSEQSSLFFEINLF
jgi:hypothetical protein